MKNFMPKSPILGLVLGLLVWALVMIPIHFIDIDNVRKGLLVTIEGLFIFFYLMIHYAKQDY